MRLLNKTALITGVAGDIGAATARRFTEEGAKVILTDLKQPENGIDEAGCEAFFQCDLSDQTAVQELFSKLSGIFDHLDILVNIAGGDFGRNVEFEDLDHENLNSNINANLASTVFTCQEAVKLMKLKSSGSIVNMSSMTGRGSSANQFAYSASKGGVTALTRTLAMTLGRHHIRVNAVAPGMIEVGTIINTLPEGVWEQISQAVGSTYPLGRVGQPIEVANCILFLASDEASFVTGETLEISGGGRL